MKLLVVNVGSNEDVSRNFWIRIESNPDPKQCKRCLHLDVNPISTVPYSLFFFTGGRYVPGILKDLHSFLRYQAYGVRFYFYR